MLLYAFRLVFGSAMVTSIALGFTTIRRGDVIGHREWMTRGYALGLGAATQMLTLMAGEIIAGPPSELSRAADGRGLGDQPRHRGMGHPHAAAPPSPHGINAEYNALTLFFALVALSYSMTLADVGSL